MFSVYNFNKVILRGDAVCLKHFMLRSWWNENDIYKQKYLNKKIKIRDFFYKKMSLHPLKHAAFELFENSLNRHL